METNQNDAGNETDARPVLTAALGYAAKGWSVMPLNGKVPVTKHGFKDATTDPDGIKTWWADCPNANVGIVTGKRSGLIVLDIDPRHGGDESLREIMEECGSFSETVVCETGGGGLHFYFRCSEEDMRGRTGILPGIDVKAEGGYVVAPPSIHPETQEAYRWKEGQGPDAVPVADVPPCLMDLINGTPAAAAKESGWNELGTIPKGKRHTVLVSLAGTMRNRGMGEEAIFQALWAENESKCTPPLPEAEIRGISQSIAKYPPGNRFEDDGPDPGALDIFMNLWEDTEVFRDELGSVYATIQQNGFRKTLPIQSSEVKGYLQYKYHALCEAYISHQAMLPFLQTLETKARMEGPTYEVFTRIGKCDRAIYVDLGNDRGEVVKITPRGWEVITDPPVRFVRSSIMKALPVPQSGGSLSQLRPFLNVATDDEFNLILAAILEMYHVGTPKPILNFQGNHGSAKSTRAKIIVELVDPTKMPLRSQPKREDDLMIAGKGVWVLAFDNMSAIPGWLSDALCRLSTGGGISKRRLYTDTDEVVITLIRPVILNGIAECAMRPDLLDRIVNVPTHPIPESARKDEETLWQEFEADRPKILGAIFDVLVEILRNIGSVRLDKKPRMADFARWVTAGEERLGWNLGRFIDLYTANIEETVASRLEGDPIVEGLMQLLEGMNPWEGSTTELLEAVSRQASETVKRGKGWPTSSKALSNTLHRLAPTLESIGIQVEFPTGSKWDADRKSSIRKIRVFKKEGKKDRVDREDREDQKYVENESDRAWASALGLTD